MLNPIGLPEAGQQEQFEIVSNCHDLYKIQARRAGDTSADAWFDLPEYPLMDSERAQRCLRGMNAHTPAFVYQAVLVCAGSLSSSVGAQL